MPIVEATNFDRNNLEFVENQCTIPGTNLKYTRFNILYKNKPFLIKTPADLVSYGMKENKLNGEDYSLSLELNDTPNEKTPFMLYLDEISCAIKDGLEQILQKDISSKLPCLYVRKSDTDEDLNPCIYPQVIYDKNQRIFYSTFINDDLNEQEFNLPQAVLNAPLYAECRLRIDNVNLIPNEKGEDDVHLHMKVSDCAFRDRPVYSELRPNVKISRTLKPPSARDTSPKKVASGKQRIYKYGDKQKL